MSNAFVNRRLPRLMAAGLLLSCLGGPAAPGLAHAADQPAAPTGPAASDNPPTSARASLEQWVQTRQLISRTRSDWESEKEILQQSKALYQRELAGIADQRSKVSTNSVQVDKERAAAEAELKESNEMLDHARASVADLEAKIRAVSTKLPTPLAETMKPLLARLPEDAKATKMGVTERVQVVVSLLNEIDKFNNAVTIASEKRKNAAGEEVAVESVYVGLGAAYFVNQSGDFAGQGQPGDKGWDWSIDPKLAPAVREIVRIYRGERTATFVPLPVTLR